MLSLNLVLILLQIEGLPPLEYRFADFHAPIETIQSPAKPVIATKAARRFRAQIRRASSQPPDFAGHLRVATWGCGTCCTQFAIVDLKTGYVYMPSFSMACGTPFEDPIAGQASLYYERDSSLLVAVGSRNESATSGIYYYRWNGHALELLRVTHERRNS